MNDNVLQFVIKAKDDASKTLNSFSETAGKMKVAFTVAGAAITAALGSTIQAAIDSQQEMAKFDTILQATRDSGTTFEKQISSTTTSLKYSSAEVANFKNKIEDARLSIKEKELSLHNLDTKLKAGKISSNEYSLAVERQKMSIKNLNSDIAEYNAKIGETTSKTTTATVVQHKQVSVTDDVRKSLLSMADATLKLGFDNEEAAVSLAKLFQRTGDVKKANDLNNLAMDLARYKNISLSEASNAVGMVLSGNTKVLKQLGITIDETKTPYEQLAEAQGKLKNQALDFSKTFAGQKEIFTQNVGEMREAIGAVFLPMLTTLVQKLIPIVEKIQEWTSANPELCQRIILVVGAIGGLLFVATPLLSLISLITTAVTLFGAALAFASANPIVLIIAGIVALGAAVYLLIQNWDAVKAKTEEIWNGVKVFMNEVLTGLGIMAQEKIDIVKQTFVNNFNAVKDTIFSIFDAIKQKVNDVLDWVSQKISSAMASFNSAVSAISTPFKSAASSVSSAVSGLFGGARADGGPVQAGRSYLVGERGPETFIPNATGRIAPSSGSGLTIVIQGNSFMGDEDAAIKIGNMIVSRLSMVQRI